jgi:hypothetical protein
LLGSAGKVVDDRDKPGQDDFRTAMRFHLG